MLHTGNCGRFKDIKEENEKRLQISKWKARKARYIKEEGEAG